MAGTYGAAGTNPYTIKGVGGILSNEVNATTGVTQIYRGNALNNQQSLGTYDPKTKKFTPQKDSLGSVIPTDAEIKALSSPEGTKAITTAAIQTAQKAGATNAQQLLSPNTASSTESADSQEGNPQAGGAGEQATSEGRNEGAAVLTTITSQIKDSNETRKVEQYPNDDLLIYPSRLKIEEQDSVRFTMLKYAPKKVSISGISRGAPFEKRESQSTRKGSTVILPIQSGISDSNSVSWNRDDMDASNAIAAVAALAGIKEGSQGLISTLKSGMDLLKTENANIKEAIAAYFAQEAASVKGLLTRTTGGIVNTNTELLFNGPELRTFTFNILMSARDNSESKNIRNIIRFFKQGMSVKRASSELFLKSPHTFQIKYYYKKTEDHPWINQIKECALTNCSVNYTPAQTYSTYDDGAMTMYEMTLQFSELEPIYDDDYGLGGGKGNESKIGY